MTAGRDDDALSWTGDDDPTLDVGAPRHEAAADETADRGPTAVPASAPVEVDAADPRAAEPLSNASLLSLGVLGGVYLLFAIGWLIGGLRLQVFALAVIPAPFFTASFVLAVAAPVLWFLTTYLLTRRSRPWLRIVWLVAGAVLLVPWPLLVTAPVLLAVGR